MSRLLALLMCAFMPLVGVHPLQLAVPEPAAAAVEPDRQLLAVYGDSFAAGYLRDGVGEANWATLVARALGMDVANDAVPGSGYVAGQVSTYPYAATTWPEPTAAVTVVFGGINDTPMPVASVAMAATVTYATIRRAAPGSALVVVGPQWATSTPTPAQAALTRAVRAAAAAAGAVWVDPSGWLAGRPSLLGADGLHPSDEGHQVIAERLQPIVAAALPHR
ncbi:SGNH/GDSL hydrolase family protein [Klenkia brasiliensis]|uniref:Lysophospholipase L1 n=1 Tax=Klenkia brasiliensis TaxID=333142 RepID=A0A1G7YF84_9ACTN|nr:SGNH/GDSL hydrolase family protein [Klenkia brasiliensis]SDG94929.1 Lysophospholipase L1 [Klenkia brasiliensis]